MFCLFASVFWSHSVLSLRGHCNLEPSTVLWLLQLSCKHIGKQATKKLNWLQKQVVSIYLKMALVAVDEKTHLWGWKQKDFMLKLMSEMKIIAKIKNYSGHAVNTKSHFVLLLRVFPASPIRPSRFIPNASYNLLSVYCQPFKHCKLLPQSDQFDNKCAAFRKRTQQCEQTQANTETRC